MAKSFRYRAGCLKVFVLLSIQKIVAAIEDTNSHANIDAGEAPIIASLDHEGGFRVQPRSHRGPLAASLLREDSTRKRKVEHRHEMLNTETGKLHLSDTAGKSDLMRLARVEGVKLSDVADLSTSSKFLHRAGDVSVAVLAGAMFSSFLAGICCVICCINLHVRKHSQFSMPLLEDQQEDEQSKEYAFQTIDSQDNKTRNWRWCKESRVQDLGVLTQAPTRPFEDFSRIDVEVEEKPVMMVLSRANVDFTQFNVKRHMEGLLLKMVGGECFFMAVADASKVLLMVESVRIRCIHEEFVLVREPDQSLLAKTLALPGVEKPTSEAPAVAARRLWSSILKMPGDSAEFIEDSIEDKEVQGGYHGIRCVERCHVMAVRFRGMPEDSLAQVGLPNHAAFSISSEDGEAPKEFSWKPLNECADIGLKLGGTDHTEALSIRRSHITNSPESEHVERIKDFLRSGGVDLEKWGEADSDKSKLKRLCEEVRAGTSVLEKTDRGVQRCVNLLLLRLWNPDESLLLVQSKSPTEAAELQLPELKKDVSENLTSAAVRLLKSKLLLSEANVRFEDEYNWEYFDETEPSKLYPGLWTKQQKFFVNAVLLDEEDEVLKRVGLPGKEVAEESDTAESGEGF